MERTYRERIFGGVLVFLPGLIGLALLGFFVYTRVSGNSLGEPSSWFFLGIGLFLVLVAINFSFLMIHIGSEGLTARFGVFSYHVPPAQIAGFHQDRNSSFSYGGFGMRFGRFDGKWRTVYNVVNAPRVVVQRRNTGNEFVFSTRDPEGVMQALRGISDASVG